MEASSSRRGVSKTLVFGGTGFISGHSTDALLEAGHAVTLANRGKSPDPFGDKVDRLRVDRDKSKACRRILKDSSTSGHWDLVVDFTAFEPREVRDVVSVLEGRVGLYVFISTDSIYDVCQPPTERRGRRESDDTLLDFPSKRLRKMEDYGYDKWRCEQLLWKYQKENSNGSSASPFPFVVLRLPDVVGEREVPSSRHYNLQSRVERGIPLRLTERMKHTICSFVYVKDVAQAVLAVSKAATTARSSAVLYQAFNIVSTEQVSLLGYLHRVANELETNLLVETVPRGSSTDSYFPSVKCGWVDGTKARRVLGPFGFQPTPVSQWLPAITRWYQKRSLLDPTKPSGSCLPFPVSDMDASSSSSDDSSSSSSSSFDSSCSGGAPYRWG